MSNTTERKYKVGAAVLIPDGMIATVADGNPADRFCTTCHCTPQDPDHTFDGSMCCPGPHYTVTYQCDECPNTHREVYAEHELEDQP